MERVFNVVVVGYGMGRYHCNLIRQVEGLCLKGVCDLDAAKREQAEADQGVRTYSAVDQVLADPGVDLVVLATPHDTHCPLAVQAMDAGKNVVLEKVMCLSTAEADTLIAARDRNGVLLSCFHNRRWDSDYLTVRRAIEQGLLGQVFYVESAITSYGRPRGWRGFRAHGGGQLNDWGAHLVDQAVQMMPAQPVSVYCRFHHRTWETDVENHAHLVINYADAAEFNIIISQVARLPKPRWYVLGEKGSLVKESLDAANRAVMRTPLGDLNSEVLLESVPGEWKDFYANVEAALRGTAPLAVTAEQVRRAIGIIEAGHRSAETGEVVRV